MRRALGKRVENLLRRFERRLLEELATSAVRAWSTEEENPVDARGIEIVGLGGDDAHRERSGRRRTDGRRRGFDRGANDRLEMSDMICVPIATEHGHGAEELAAFARGEDDAHNHEVRCVPDVCERQSTNAKRKATRRARG